MNVNLYINNSEPLKGINRLTVDPKGVVMSRSIEDGATLPLPEDWIKFNLYADSYANRDFKTLTIECWGKVTARVFDLCHSEPTLNLHITLDKLKGDFSESDMELLGDLVNLD